MISTQKRDVQDWLDSMRGIDDPDAGGPGGNKRWLPRSRGGASIAILALLVMAGFWIWAFSPLAPSGHPDTLNNTLFTARAESICLAATEEAGLVPLAAEATGPEDRATQIRKSTLVFDGMAADLRTEADEQLTGNDADLVDDWLADWDTYLDNRRDYAVTLAGGDDPPFTVTARDGDAVTSYIDIFADVNSMSSCGTPEDV